MEANKKHQGNCLCGKITVSVSKLDPKLGVCHCNMCRKWGGGPLMAVDCGTQVEFSQQDLVGRFESSDWAERGFCKSCGTHLFYRLKQNNQFIMPVDLFDDSAAIVFDHQIFIDEKPGYYSFANATHNMTGEDVFAQYSTE